MQHSKDDIPLPLTSIIMMKSQLPFLSLFFYVYDKSNRNILSLSFSSNMTTIPAEILQASQTFGGLIFFFFPLVWENVWSLSLQIFFSAVFSLTFFSQDSNYKCVRCFGVIPQIANALFHFFTLFVSVWMISIDMSLLILSSVVSNLLNSPTEFSCLTSCFSFPVFPFRPFFYTFHTSAKILYLFIHVAHNSHQIMTVILQSLSDNSSRVKVSQHSYPLPVANKFCLLSLKGQEMGEFLLVLLL